MKQRQISISPPDNSEEEINEVRQALRSGWSTTGPRTKEFEQEIAAYCHTEKAVCLNSATACMELILRILGVGPGDEVITSAYTYTATASVPCHHSKLYPFALDLKSISLVERMILELSSKRER